MSFNGSVQNYTENVVPNAISEFRQQRQLQSENLEKTYLLIDTEVGLVAAPFPERDGI